MLFSCVCAENLSESSNKIAKKGDDNEKIHRVEPSTPVKPPKSGETDGSEWVEIKKKKKQKKRTPPKKKQYKNKQRGNNDSK